MAIKHIFAAALFLLAIAAPCRAFDAASFLPENSSFFLYNFTHENQSLQALLSGSTVHAILAPSFPFGDYEPLQDSFRIESALRSYYIATGHSPGEINKLQAVHEGIKSVSGDRLKGEAKCRVLLGTDRNPCVDFETCRYACVSVTSFCQNFMYSGAPREFINVISDFENASKALGTAYEQEKASYGSMADDPSKEKIEAYISSLGEVNRAATKASASPLFDAYSYCFSPDYSLGVITNMQLSAQKYWKSSSIFFSLHEEAAAVQQRTAAGLQMAEEAKRRQPAPKANATQNGTALPPLPPPPPLQPPEQNYFPFAAAGMVFFMVAIAMASLLYCLKKRKKGPRAPCR